MSHKISLYTALVYFTIVFGVAIIDGFVTWGAVVSGVPLFIYAIYYNFFR